MISEKDILVLSVKDLLTPKMIKYSILPFIISMVLIYSIFFILAGMGLENMGSVDVSTTQTTMQDGIPHTDSFQATIEGSAIMQFFMSYAITSWIASFLVYAIGGFLMLYLSIFIAVIIIGFLTPHIIKELQIRHYQDVKLSEDSNLFEAIFLTIKWAFMMVLMFFLLFPLYFIPIINIVAFNFPLYYFFHKMLNYDVGLTICSMEEFKKINYFNSNNIRAKTLFLYLVSLIPFVVFFTLVFFVIYLGHTYFRYKKGLL